MIRPGPGPFLWIGSRSGLYRVHIATGAILPIRSPQGGPQAAPGRNINSLALDRKGRMWIGSFGGGLTMITGWNGSRPAFRRFGTAEGLPHVNVDGVRTDGDGIVWVSTDDGLARIDPATLAIGHASHADGAFLTEYSAGASAVTAQGEALFGAIGGLIVVRPGQLLPWRVRPAIVVTDIRSGDRSVPAGPFNEAGGTAVIEVRPDANSLAVEFAALDFSSPERNRYAYRLEGYDADWIKTDASRRLAIYTNLPPGDYVLRLRGTNRAGLWSAEDRALTVRVHPAWHQQLWVQLTGSLLAILAIAGLVRWRTALLRRRQIELERQIAERTADLRAAMDRLGQLVTTDPLTECANRWYFIDEARDAIAREKERGGAVSLIVLDIDYFKQVNDSFGHPAGDAVLAKAGQILRGLARPDDLIGRMGGEEFALLLPEMNAPVAGAFAEALRLAIGEGKVAPHGETISVTASLGVAEMRPGEDFEALYARADKALYVAKNAGRNRVELVD
jgi:diguanylate cyclase (GGDEF)-like protein